MQPKRIYREMFLPSLFLILFIVPMIFMDSLAENMTNQILQKIWVIFPYIFGIFYWVSIAWFSSKLLDTVVWESICSKRLGISVPKMLKDIIRFGIFSVCILGILGAVFNLPVTGLLATSGAVGVMVGFALKETMGDVFSGIAINLERPYKIGEYIEMENGISGEVVDISWRTTTILPLSNIASIVPNHKMAEMEIKNFSRPKQPFRWNLEIYLDFNVSTEKALRIFAAAVKAVQLDIPGTKSDVLIRDVSETGVLYRIRYWSPEYMKLNPTRTKVISNVMKHLFQAGITPVHPKRDMYFAEMPSRELDLEKDQYSLLSRMDLFKPLNQQEKETLSEKLAPKEIKAGETIITEGTEGDSLFLILEGLCFVFINIEDNEGQAVDLHVGNIEAGQFFGEFSLLSGEKRSATIIAETDCVAFEITRNALAPLLEQRPALMGYLSEILAERKLKNDATLKSLNEEEKAEKKTDLVNTMLTKMKSVFSMLKIRHKN